MHLHQLTRPFRILFSAAKRFYVESFFYRVSALTFSLLLAIVPYLLVSVFFFTHFPAMTEILALGRKYILEHFVPTSAIKMETYFYHFVHQASNLPATNLIFLIISVSMMVSTIEESLNTIWLVPSRSSFSLVFVLNWFFFLLLPFTVGLSVFVSTYLFSSYWITIATHWMGISTILLMCIPVLINTLIFTLMYVLIPNTYVTWREGLACGILASFLFEAARICFEFYITRFSGYELIYGIFAIIPIFLLWLYLLWFIILFSALLIQEAKQFDALQNAL